MWKIAFNLYLAETCPDPTICHTVLCTRETDEDAGDDDDDHSSYYLLFVIALRAQHRFLKFSPPGTPTKKDTINYFAVWKIYE